MRLKARSICRAAFKLQMFQFQTGAIKSCNQQTLYPQQRSFNSKLVRLKAPVVSRGIDRPAGFNSKLVRLKAIIANLSFMIISCFNSKLVRLKESPSYYPSSPGACFNSKLVRLKGSRIPLPGVCESVSIPNWCD